uniref:Uncharacterized protein n=1 Tax=viral metagenome TaxID=1070528 RepID=A0A6C0C1X6_9ZZZZ
MSMLPYLSSVTCTEKNNNTAKVVNALATVVYFAVFGLAIFLAIRDMNSLDTTASKVWLFVFALFAPELYVIIHGLSSSSMGMPFFSETAVEVPFSMSHGSNSATPSHEAATNMAAHIQKASDKLNSQSTVDALSSLASSL